ncbi:hypothetical protein ALC62_03300 [Cyphomyrmex costatus]|uniref:Uncharacterized protein n=1 Tax=Cyphomyrmex costatus TaxID=456900 RepID=A0A151ILQ5_9HYME|nr:hypothetical protein ALC62_03300 [Cyphomyrmex costatus]
MWTGREIKLNSVSKMERNQEVRAAKMREISIFQQFWISYFESAFRRRSLKATTSVNIAMDLVLLVCLGTHTSAYENIKTARIPLRRFPRFHKRDREISKA